MQHLNWLVEKIININGDPRIEHAEVDQSTKTPNMLQANIKIEQEVAAAYDHAVKETADPDLKKLLYALKRP